MLLEKYKVLVVCTGNSARSIMAEAIFNCVSGKYFQAFSAGSKPVGKVNPFALEQISEFGLDYAPRSKSWDEFTSVPVDFVITVCDSAANEVCPNFPGDSKRVHWGLPDPASVEGADDAKRAAFGECLKVFEYRVKQLITAVESGVSEDIYKTFTMLSNVYPK